MESRINLYKEYKLTEKGEFYMQMANWEDYISKCGDYGKSILVDFGK